MLHVTRQALVDVSLRGPYQGLVTFFAALAQLPRMVTIMDLSIERRKDSTLLTATCIAAGWCLAEKNNLPAEDRHPDDKNG